MSERNVLRKDDRVRLTGMVRDCLAEHRVARRANAILLIDRGWTRERVSEALLLDFADTVLTFLTQTVPKHFDRLSDRITDKSPVLAPTEFRVLAS